MGHGSFLRLSVLAAMLAASALTPVAGARAEGVVPPASQSAPADARAAILHLSEVMQMGGVVEVMRAEGMDYGTLLRDEMFPGKGGSEWAATVALTYDPARMRAEFEDKLVAELLASPETVQAGLAFFGDARGQKILSLELEARRALMDDAAEAAAKAAVADMEAEGSPRLDALRRFAAANDLVEMNVMGALNANLAFYKGLSAGGAFGSAMTEEDMLADVWGQEADVRAETEEWLWSYLSLAYQPLSDEELQAYHDFSETPEGQKLNAAVFAAFDVSFVRISEDLGRAAARAMQGEDI